MRRLPFVLVDFNTMMQFEDDENVAVPDSVQGCRGVRFAPGDRVIVTDEEMAADDNFVWLRDGWCVRVDTRTFLGLIGRERIRVLFASATAHPLDYVTLADEWQAEFAISGIDGFAVHLIDGTLGARGISFEMAMKAGGSN